MEIHTKSQITVELGPRRLSVNLFQVKLLGIYVFCQNFAYLDVYCLLEIPYIVNLLSYNHLILLKLANYMADPNFLLINFWNIHFL